MRVTGRVLDIDHGTQLVPDDQGVAVERHTTTLHVLEGREVTRVKLGRDFPPADAPEIGDDVDLVVSVAPWAGRNGDARYSVLAIKKYDPATLAVLAAVS